MRRSSIAILGLATLTMFACKKEGCTDPTASNYNADATKDDGSCITPPSYTTPSTYVFTRDGNSTVSYSGQTERLNQLAEMTTKAKGGVSATVSASDLHDMFANTNGDGGGNFSFNSSKQLENKCFATDVQMFKNYMDSIAVASTQNGTTASNGQAGTISTNDGAKTYLVSANGIEYVQLMEKGLMGAVFMNQALNTYFGSGKMDVNNTDPVDAANGKYYTSMEHHWDEAFGYFGVPVDFPTNLGEDRFWGKYCNKRDAELGCNATMMNNFLKGRAAITGKVLADRDAAIEVIRKEWEKISAAQALYYLNGAKAAFGNDNAKYIHEMSEAYAFILNLKYCPTETRVMTISEVEDVLNNTIGDNLWTVTTADIDAAISTISTKYGL